MNIPLKFFEKDTPERYILLIAIRNSYVTNWYWNDSYLGYCDRFCYKQPKLKSKQSFYYRVNKLIRMNLLSDSIVLSLGSGSMNEFGTTTQTSWNLIDTWYYEFGFNDLKEAKHYIHNIITSKDAS